MYSVTGEMWKSALTLRLPAVSPFLYIAYNTPEERADEEVAFRLCWMSACNLGV